MSLSNDLNCRVAIYTRHAQTTQLGDTDFINQFRGFYWAKIVPIMSNSKNIVAMPGDMQVASLRHIITVRANVMANVDEDMFVVYKNRRYNVDTWRYHYKSSAKIELICTMEAKPYV